MKKKSGYRWFVFSVFLVFMLLHQTDKLLIGPLTSQIMETFGINEAQMGFVFSGAIVVGAILYPLWGWLYDRYARSKLLALAAFIWGATTWLSAIVRTFPGFLATRASTGIDDSSYPGLYNLMADYFEPKIRGRVFGFLQLTGPIGYALGMVLAIVLGGMVGWRGVFYITGSLGIVMAVVIFFFVKEPTRGSSEPELQSVEMHTQYRFSFKTAAALFKKPTLIFMFLNAFFGVFPWQVITFWSFRYLETERGYDDGTILITMMVSILMMSIGYPFAGWLGDRLFKRTLRGRLIVSGVGIFLGIVFAALALTTPIASRLQFGIFLATMSFFMPFAASNMLATIYDITLPEVRSTSNAIFNFAEQIGSASAPSLAGLIAVQATLGSAMLWITVIAWSICLVMLLIAISFVSKDILRLRSQLSERASLENSNQPTQV
jgi:MFS family permease